MENEFRAIKDYEGLYSINRSGVILSHYYDKNGRPLKPAKSPHYLIVCLHKQSRTHMKYVHRLLAQAFITDLSEDDEVNHKDGNKLNNSLENLEVLDRAGNARHASENGLLPNGERNGSAKLTDIAIAEIRMRYAAGGISQYQLAREYQVTQTLISCITLRKIWKHVK